MKFYQTTFSSLIDHLSRKINENKKLKNFILKKVPLLTESTWLVLKVINISTEIPTKKFKVSFENFD